LNKTNEDFYMRITILTLWGLTAVCGSASAGSFIWFNGPANPVTAGPAGPALAGDSASPALGCFAQLIDAGADGKINPARDKGSAVTGDDRVVSTRWFGAGGLGDGDGVIGPGKMIQATGGEQYYVRAWSAPAASYADGIPPSFQTAFYGDSDLWAFTGGGEPPQVPVYFNFGGAGFATIRKAGADTDGDLLPDWWEFLHARHPTAAGAGEDSDGDRQSNLEEFVAGTDASNAGSVFAAEATASDSGFSVRWPSDEDRTYAIYRSVNLADGFVKIAAGIAAHPPENEFRDDAAEGCSFYLVEVEP
jgi:hypothetical protein